MKLKISGNEFRKIRRNLMQYKKKIKPTPIFLCLYALCIVSLYYIGYTEFNFDFPSFSIGWLLMNIWFLLPYIVGGGLVFFLGFSNIKRWLVNLASIISCSVVSFSLLLVGNTGSTGLEVLGFIKLTIWQVCFVAIFTAVIYFVGEMIEDLKT
ncbi:MAG: hypothetical protein ACSHXJ_15320 [Marinomonas colpomeniae]